MISPDATRPPGRKPRRPVIVATRCCGAAHGGPSLALTGCACLAGANDVRSPVAVSDNDPTRRPKTGMIDHADQDSLAVKTFNCDPGCRGARPLLTRQHAATPLNGMPFRMIAAAAPRTRRSRNTQTGNPTRMMTATRAASSRGDCRAIRASNASSDICCPRWNLGCIRGWGTLRRQEKSHRLESAAFSLVGR